MSDEARAPRLGLLKSLKDLARSGATLDASIVTTYAFNGLFYEEVMLRAFERAGSRLNIVLADAGQLAESLSDPLRRPSRAGTDYLLVPIPHVGAFHPKIIAMLSERQPLLALGSHNLTDAGFSHNEELTAYWGSSNPAPPAILAAAVEYALRWLEPAGAVPSSLLTDVVGRVRTLAPVAQPAANDEMSLIVSSAETALWPQLRDKVVGPVKRVTVVGPYFDARMDFFAAVARDLAPEEIIVAIQPQNAVLPRPDLAPEGTRFVDAEGLQAFWPKAGEVGFAHGKAVAIESAGGVVVSLGSANSTGAAWLAQTRWNVEANLCLTGAAAATAFTALGLDRLAQAPEVASAQLAEIATRSQALRSQERAAADASGPSLVSGRLEARGVFLAGFATRDDPAMTLVEPAGGARPIRLEPCDGGSLLVVDGDRPSAGLYDLRSGSQTLAFVVINDAQALRAAALPRDGARILDHLGTLDSGTGFTELLDLLDKHVLGPAEGTIGASRAAPATSAPADAAESEAPFGPRGVSLPVEAELGLARPRLSDGLIADIIAALIRALGAPPPAPTTDGDAPDLDEGDAEDGPSSDDLARNLDARVEAADVDWPRLVTACRKRLSVMLKRLQARLEEAGSAGYPPSWSLGRLVVVLSLLHRLRSHPPQVQDALSGRARPTSLVSRDQLSIAFNLAVRALYGPAQLALKLEGAAGSRAAEERRLIDNLLLWFAREVGADCWRRPREPLDAARLQAKADLAPVAMSAAAYPSLEPWAERRDPWLAVWDDAVAAPEDWCARNLAYGALLQRARGQERTAPAVSPVAGDIVIWLGEPDLPWVVASVSGPKMSLTEPAGVQGEEKRVLARAVTLLDLTSLPAAVA